MFSYNPYQRPNGFQPQNFQPQNFQQQLDNIIKVTGVDGAKAFQMGANQTVVMFDVNDDVFYEKSTDGAGFPTLRLFKFEEITTPPPSAENNYVTKEEMENYVKQLIQNARARSETKPTTNIQPNQRES